jgi:hypothetical protein
MVRCGDARQSWQVPEDIMIACDYSSAESLTHAL